MQTERRRVFKVLFPTKKPPCGQLNKTWELNHAKNENQIRRKKAFEGGCEWL
jgi:hypothetical protein